MHNPNTIALPLDEDFADLLAQLQRETGLTPAGIIQKLLPAHLDDLWTLQAFYEYLPPDSPIRDRAKYLIHNFGPTTLTQSIKALDPNYVTPGEKFLKECFA